MTCADVIPILKARLADRIDLMHQAKQVHWNVKDPNVIALHKLFDEGVDAVEERMDRLAEWVVQLGGTAEGTIPIRGSSMRTRAQPLMSTRICRPPVPAGPHGGLADAI
jgi:starvation-inducible DNA-binding protein